ncbi:MAG: SRPBCC family protein [Halolamina sp.]
MVRVSESVTVEAPKETVWEFMDDPHNQPVITPSITAVDDVDQRPDGKSLDCTYTMAGVDLETTLRTTTYDPGEHVVFEMDGGLEGEIEWRFEAADEGTDVTYAADFAVPGEVMERVVEPLIRRYNERELSTTLANLKTRLEAETA